MYLVTGATGFIGKHLVGLLLKRGGPVFVLVRRASRGKVLDLARRWNVDDDRLVPVIGDVGEPGCGLEARALRKLKASVRHVFHLAAVYDMTADLDAARRANVDGTRHVLQVASRLGARLHYVSTIAVAGDYSGSFREDMYDEGQQHGHPYFLTKFEAEGVVRQECTVPFRIYRPGIVIGSSQTGETGKIDGPYYAFKAIQRMRAAVPAWMPMIGLEGGKLNLVPVDYVAQALDHIAHADGLDGRTFHLTDPKPLSFGDAMNEFCKAAHAPQFTARIDSRAFGLLPHGFLQLMGNIAVVRAVRREVLADLGIPVSVLRYVNWRSNFDCRDAQAALRGSGIECPPLPTYAWKIWDYWERHLDPELFRDRSLAGLLRDKVVVVTGASSGIGQTLAIKLGRTGAMTVLVARSADKLADTQAAIEADGGRARVFPCDLSIPERCEDLATALLGEFGHVDVLINNAGRSIRRSVSASYDRFHDFQRTMAVNYFGPVKLILGLLPSMRSRRGGHVINVSSIGVQTNTPRFAAYVASKAALDAFSKCLATEIVSDRVAITTVYMPLVRTPMIAPTRIYDALPTLAPDEAADMILGAILTRQKRVSTRLGTFGEVLYALAPRAVDRILNAGYQLFPETPPTRAAVEVPVSTGGVAFGHLLRGIHW